MVLDRVGWNSADARFLGLALWRNGEFEEAESVLRRSASSMDSIQAWVSLTDFYLGTGRWSEAEIATEQGLAVDPLDCDLAVRRAAVLATRGNDSEALGVLRKILPRCPPLMWTKQPLLRDRAEREGYRQLLDKAVLLSGWDELPEAECLERMILLRPVFSSEDGPLLAALLRKRTEYSVRNAGLGLLMGVDPAPVEAWESLLKSEDIGLRLMALRKLAHSPPEALLPLFLARKESEKGPECRALLTAAAADLLSKRDEAQAFRLAREVPADSEAARILRTKEWFAKAAQTERKDQPPSRPSAIPSPQRDAARSE